MGDIVLQGLAAKNLRAKVPKPQAENFNNNLQPAEPAGTLARKFLAAKPCKTISHPFLYKTSQYSSLNKS